MNATFAAELNQKDLRRVQQAKAGIIDFASTTEQLVVDLILGVATAAPYNTPGAAWLRLDDRQRALVKCQNLRAATIALKDAPRAAAAGFGNHGGPLGSISDNDNHGQHGRH